MTSSPDSPQPADARPDEADDVVEPEDAVTVEDPDGPGSPSEAMFTGSPAKVMRIGTMVKQLLEEVRNAPLDEAARARMAEVHDRSLHELEEGLSDELVAELRRITLPFSDDESPSDAELRVAQAQLVGWLEGLFHGLQTALVAQQMSTQAQLAQMRRALPPGSIPPGAMGMAPGQAGEDGEPRRQDERHPGQYL
ncbi:bacterial proteasome activator family protein [Actinotalea sp. Marseille-Q4924]|uniref:bacterial proteasome activator family protein n=1 Tax=Actinotalea sp. Marseille-Q4924 TaxID=2866571 RepID=UPI001CE45ED0|nr:bacterial proteasome activator family protein [Actinotalea sp. Marseille-Q4924]